MMMGALALLVEEPYVAEVPKRFRFSDENPLTLEPYAQGRFGDLPPYIEDVIVEQLGLSPTRWNALVDSGQVYSVAGPDRWFSLQEWLSREVVRRATGTCPRNACGDCWGTWLDFDDGSCTGTVGAAMLCWCTRL